jgi:hypothetical protein
MAYSSTPTGSGGVQVHWNGYKIIQQVNQGILRAAERSRQRAQRYWQEEWTPERHPYMTGNEESILRNGFWRVVPVAGGHVHLEGGSTSRHTMFEEYGTSHQPAHAPIRRTVDRVKYYLAADVRWGLKQSGL